MNPALRVIDVPAGKLSETQICGIGRWTAEMLLIFHVGRPDVLPSDDYGVRKGFAITYDRELPSPKELAAYGTRWKPYRTVASWYLWRGRRANEDPLGNALSHGRSHSDWAGPIQTYSLLETRRRLKMR